MVKKAYSVETKLGCIEMKKAGKSNKVIMETLGIKNDSQIYTWMRWHKNEELYRFHQPVGKQKARNLRRETRLKRKSSNSVWKISLSMAIVPSPDYSRRFTILSLIARKFIVL